MSETDFLSSLYEKALSSGSRLKEKEERKMLKNAKYAYLYAKYVRGEIAKMPNNGAWDSEDLDVFFAGHPKWAYLYSVFVEKNQKIVRFMLANAISGGSSSKCVDNSSNDIDWPKRFFDEETGVDKIRQELAGH